MKLYIIRHGETTHNALGKLQGHYDSKLSKKGEQQSHKLGKYLKKKNIFFDHIYSSDLQRATKTAEIIASYQKTPILIKKTKLLRERKLGVFENKKKPDIIKKTSIKKIAQRFPSRILGIEPNKKFLNRCQLFLHEIIQTHTNKEHIAIITHAGTINYLTSSLYHQTHEQIKTQKYDNTSISIFELNIEQLAKNQTIHLN